MAGRWWPPEDSLLSFPFALLFLFVPPLSDDIFSPLIRFSSSSARWNNQGISGNLVALLLELELSEILILQDPQLID